MGSKNVVKRTKYLVEAFAIKNEINNLNKKLGKRERAKIRRTINMEFEVFV